MPAPVEDKPLPQPPVVQEVEERHDGRSADLDRTNLSDGRAHEEDDDGSQEDDSSDTESEYLSSSSDSDADDTDEDPTEEARAAERKARALERQRVLEAAGFIIKADVKPPPRPPRPKKERKRRPPPAVPDRQHAGAHSRDTSADLDVSGEADNSLRLDDAFERYEAYRKANPNMNRLSLASMESSTSGTPASPTLSLAASTIQRSSSAEPESRSPLHFLSIFGRKTPANDGETRTMPVISAPISRDNSSPGTDADNAFGSVSCVSA